MLPFFSSARPFTRLLLPLALGIGVSPYVSFSVETSILLFALCLVGSLTLWSINQFLFKGENIAFAPKKYIPFSLGLFGILFLFGLLRTYWQDERLQAQHFSHFLKDTMTVTGVVEQPIKSGYGKHKTILRLSAVGTSPTTMQTVSGHLLVYFSDTAAANLKYGEEVIFRSKINPIKPPANPYQFDNRSYLAYKNIFHKAYIDSAFWQKRTTAPSFSIYKYTYAAQKYCVEQLDKGLDGNEFGVASALLVGSTNEIDEEVRDAYVNTGAMHILSVSGMHLMLVYGFLLFILTKLPFRGKHWKIGKTAFLIASIWGFALLTGASSAAIRAAVMLTLHLVSLLMLRKADTLNTLFSCAFLMLCYNPYWLFDMGFQLSFSAMMGLLLFQKPIENLWIIAPILTKKELKTKSWSVYFKKKGYELLGWSWSVTAAGIAAQLMTLPLSLYYFHQFPTYFWLAGLLLIPISEIVIPLGVLYLLVSWIPYISNILAFLVGKLIWLMNQSLFLIEEKLPKAVITGIWFHKHDVLLCFLFLMAVYNLLPLLEKKTDKQQILIDSILPYLQNEAAKNTFQKLKIWIYVGILTQLCLGISLAYHSWKQTNSETLAVYHIYQQTAILWRKGNEGVLLTSSNFTKNSFDFNLKNHIVSLGNPHLDTCKIGNETVSKRLWTWKPPILSTPFGRIAIITPDFNYNRSAKPLKVRAVVLSNKPKISLPELQTLFDTPHIIADGTNSQYRIQKWEKTAPSTTLLYKTSLSGTFLSIN